MRPVGMNLPAATLPGSMAGITRSIVKAAGEVSAYLDSASSQIGGRLQGLIAPHAGPVHLAGAPAAGAANPQVTAQAALAPSMTNPDPARDYGVPHQNIRFAAGLSAQETYWMTTDVGMPNGKNSTWDQFNAAKALRPDPQTYLDQTYIDQHLAQFDEGAITFITPSSFEKFTVPALRHGRPDGLFVMPAKWVSQMINEAKQDSSVRAAAAGDKKRAMIGVIEQKLSVPAGAWSDGGKLLAIVVERPRDLNLRMATGREGGANMDWRPGGYTLGGVPEAFVDQAAVDQGIAVPFAHLPEVLEDRVNLPGGRI